MEDEGSAEPAVLSAKKRSLGGGHSNGFKALNLSETVYNGTVRMGFRMPTPVQRKSLPIALSGVDTVVMARTGSGKTCAFLIPLLEKLLSTPKGDYGNHVRGLILSPTRELSVQTLKVFNKLAANAPGIRAVGIHGGEGMEKQFHLLASKPDIIVATPGRIAHHLTEIPDFKLSGCMMCVLDEADRLLEMGFSVQIRQIARTLPESCQKLLFSATMPKVLVEFTKSGFARDPTVVRLDQEATVSDELRIAFVTCRSADKDATLLFVLHQILRDKESHSQNRTGLTLIFAATRHHVEYITTLLLSSGIDATMIYGSLDQEARKSNLAAFRSGKRPVLVVTDVAARGIDVPLIDHVVHYHFPSSPKLFIHRSGRCARAGRVGFCWGLVEPDELAYMIDLHLFLGRRPSTGDLYRSEGVETFGDTCDRLLTYSLSEMTPDMVHYGSVPESFLADEIENVQRITGSEISGSLEAESLRSLTKVCTNAMKQYRRTRIEASKEGIRRGKAILEGDRLDSGRRIGTGSIPPHPLFRAMERNRQTQVNGLDSVENSVHREDFLRAMSNFRPKETVFEAFATGGGKEAGIFSQVDKGRTVVSNKRLDSSAALNAMKGMRRQMRIARDKGTSLVVAGSMTCDAVLKNCVDSEIMGADAQRQELGDESLVALNRRDGKRDGGTSKHRISRAERRQMKKSTCDQVSQNQSVLVATTKPTKRKRGSDFRDTSFFIQNDSSSSAEEAQRSRQIEATLQPSAASASRGGLGTALRMEEAMLDIVGDEREELVRKHRMMRWDKSKRKYVQTTIGAELSGESKSKKLRLENGTLIKKEQLKLGELYEKWQKKTNRSIGRSGVFDDSDGGYVSPPKHEASGAGRNITGSGGNSKELKSATAIRKERERKQNLKMKNMKKVDRRAIEQKNKERRSSSGKRTMNAPSGRRR